MLLPVYLDVDLHPRKERSGRRAAVGQLMVWGKPRNKDSRDFGSKVSGSQSFGIWGYAMSSGQTLLVLNSIAHLHALVFPNWGSAAKTWGLTTAAFSGAVSKNLAASAKNLPANNEGMQAIHSQRLMAHSADIESNEKGSHRPLGVEALRAACLR